jgi:hypothetical protein
MRRSLFPALIVVLTLATLILCGAPVLAEEHYQRYDHPQVEGLPYGFWRNDALRMERQAQREAERRFHAEQLRQQRQIMHIHPGVVQGNHHR